MAFAHFNGHRAHDVALLARRWAALARSAGFQWKRFATAGEYPVHFVGSAPRRNDERPTLYISAGVHGDEAAPPWGLLEWAEENVDLLQSHRFLFFPCLNPHGLALNTRVDHRDLDINRRFHLRRDPLVAAWRQVVGSRPFAVALCLHEDYDAQGCYIYELTRQPGALGRKILADCDAIIPHDRRRSIDGRRANAGLIIRRVPPELPGLPEAIALHHMRAPVTLTFESPSEYSLLDRIAVQKQFIRSALRHELGL